MNELIHTTPLQSLVYQGLILGLIVIVLSGIIQNRPDRF